MLDENKHIDSLFADGLKGLSVEPNPQVWNAVNGKMLAKRRKKMLVIYISTGIAAAILLLFTITNQALFDVDSGTIQFEQISATTNTDSEEIKENEIQEFNSQNIEVKNTKSTDLNSTISKPESNVSKSDVPIVRESKAGSIPKESIINSIPIEFSRLFTRDKDSSQELKFNLEQKVDPVVLLADELQIKVNLMLMEQESKDALKEKRWSILGQISSAYSNETSAESAASGIVSFGGAVKVNYALGKKLALQTGFLYNSFGQDLSNGGGQEMLFYDANLTGESGSTFDGSNRRKVFPARTSAGAIKFSNHSSQVANSEYVSSSYSTSSEIMQNFETIEVPFILRYSLSQKRLGVFVSGGLGANFIVANGVYDTSGSKRKIGEIENLRTTNFSSLVGLGFEYKLNSKLQIGVEPTFKYYLNSINKSSEFDYKPYSIGILTGIRYNF